MDGVTREGMNVAQNEAFLSPAAVSKDVSSDQCAKQPRWLYAQQTKANDKMPSTEKLAANKGPSTMEKSYNRQSRKKIEYNTIEQKLKIIHEYKHLTKSGAKEQYAKNLGVSQSTITRWVKREKDLLKAKDQGRGKKKATYEKDGLIRIKLDLMRFYELNEKMPDALKLPISGDCYCCDICSLYCLINIHLQHNLLNLCIDYSQQV